jgi:Tol biopolymer transport system component
MLSGKRPFTGGTTAEVMTAILREDPPELAKPDAPAGLERVVRRCLEKRPEERFQSARDVAFALEAVRDAGPTRPTALRWPGHLAAVARRPLLAVVTVAGLLAASLVASWWLLPRPTSQVAGSRQLTFIGAVGAPGARGEWFQAILTDGARIYFSDCSRRFPGLAYVSKAGGEVVRIPSPVESSQLLGLSPDGGRLLVRDWSLERMEGALWVVPTSGGAPTRLGDVMAHDAAWSPDGRSLVYARGEDLYLAGADGGQARRLATTPGRAHWIRWSPDGLHLRFTLIETKGDGRSLWAVSADGTDLHALPIQWDEERRQVCCGDWSRDGRRFAFTAQHEGGASLWMLDEAGAGFGGRRWKPSRLTSDAFHLVAAIPSLDGKELYAVQSLATPQALQYDPRSRQLVASPFHPTAYFVEFSRDGQWMAYVEAQASRHVLKRSRLDGSHALQLTNPTMDIWAPRWSPDGTQIAFLGKRPGEPFKAYIVSRDGGVPQQVLAGERNEVDLDWSPDGRSLMFGRPPEGMAEAGAPRAIHIVDLKSKHVSTLPHSEGLFASRWSPDGRHVIAATPDSHKLMIFDFETADWSDLVGPGTGVGSEGLCRPLCGDTRWSVDGRHVYVRSGPDVIRVALADRRIEPVLKVADLGPTVVEPAFVGLTPENLVLLWNLRWSSDIHALEWRVP